MRKKILVVCNSSSGFYRLRKELIAKAIKQYDIHILAPDTGYTQEMKSMGCEYSPIVYDGHSTNPISETKLMAMYYKHIKSLRPDIVLTYAIKPNTYAGIICKRLGIPYIVNITGLGTAVEYKSILQSITLFLYRKSLRNAQMVYFQNSENMDFMKTHKTLGERNYQLIPGSGVNLEQYKYLSYPKEEITRFIFVARVIKEKGIDQYLDAARQYKSEKDIEFHICGKCDPEYSSIIEELHREGVIIYHGAIESLDEIVKVYQMSSCIIHPTYYPEGISNVLLEAAASGRPIIATNRSGCREVVDEGINGFLIKQKDSSDLISAVKRFLSLTISEREKMGLMGRRKIESGFNREIIVDNYLDQISKALNK